MTLVNLSYTRYFVIIPFCMALIGVFVITNYRRNKISNGFWLIGLSLLLLIGVMQNYLLFKDRAVDPTNAYSQPVPLEPEEVSVANYSNVLNIKIAHIAEIHGLKKGYADYWSAPINTYFADSKVQFLPLWCGPGNKLAPYNWSLDTRTLHLSVKTSFFLYNSSADMSSSNLWCGSPPHFLAQLGRPTKIIPVTAGIRFYVYNYDILHAMNASSTKDAGQ
jgi:energy-coupling factor transporter transmembrane protein EcfT